MDEHARYPTTLEKAIRCLLADEDGVSIASGVMFQPDKSPIIFCMDGPEAAEDALLTGTQLKRDHMTIRGRVMKIESGARPWGRHLRFEPHV